MHYSKYTGSTQSCSSFTLTEENQLLSGYSVQSTEERSGIRVLLILDENHFCLIFILEEKNHQLMSSDFMT